MYIIKCIVRGQSLSVITPLMADLTINYFNLFATFSHEWDGLDIVAHIHLKDNAEVGSDWIITNGEVRSESGINLTAGMWEIWFSGSKFENGETVLRITTEIQYICIKNTGTDGGIMPDIPESTAEQILSIANDAYLMAESVRDDADNGEFDGATFTPAVSAEGVLSWTNDKELPNPEPVSIRGPQGEQGVQGVQGPQGEQGEPGEDAPDDYVLVQDTQPTSETNRIWVRGNGPSVQVATMGDLDAVAGSPIVDTVSGAVASFPDGAGNVDFIDVTCGIEPVQDLHGYDYPWPAGGGKNKFVVASATWAALSGITYVYDASTNTLSKSGTSTGATGHNVATLTLPDGTYTISAKFEETGSATGIRLRKTDASTNAVYIGADSPSATVSLNGEYYLRLSTEAGETGGKISEIQIELSATKTAYEPPQNICPISGHSTVNIWNDPDYTSTIDWNQIFPYKTESGTAQTGVTYASTGDGKYTVITDETRTSAVGNVTSLGSGTWTAGHIYAWLGTRNGVGLRLKGWSKDTDSVFKVTTPAYNNIGFTFENLPAGSYDVYPMLLDLTQMFGESRAEEILAMGSADGAAYVKSLFPKDYYPYNLSEKATINEVNGGTYQHVTVALGNTYYYGTLDVTSGVLTVDGKFITADGVNVKTTGGYGASGAKWLPAIVLPSNEQGVWDTMKTSYLKTKPPTLNVQNDQNTADFGNGGAIIALHIGTMQGTDGTHGYNSANEVHAAVNSYLQSNNLQICYKMKTSTTIQLTPQDIEALLGDNNVWCDTGNTTVTYYANTKLYIDKKIAEALGN